MKQVPILCGTGLAALVFGVVLSIVASACTQAECLRESDCKGGYDCYIGLCKRVAPLAEGGVVIVWIDGDAAQSTDAAASTNTASPTDAAASTDASLTGTQSPVNGRSDASSDASTRGLLDASVELSTDAGN
ncbi:MAG: hypothetical protein RJA70_3392 [Pseudomonadota bacterium]|jgi:hypothetical protein